MFIENLLIRFFSVKRVAIYCRISQLRSRFSADEQQMYPLVRPGQCVVRPQ